MNRMNGDGKHVPNNRFSTDGQSPAPPNHQDQHEQQIITALTERYGEIETLWKEAEEDLKQFRVSNAVEHCYLSDYEGSTPVHYSLCWTRYGKAWRIVHERRIAYSEFNDNGHDEVEQKPIIDCHLDLRTSMIAEFATLRKKVIEEAKNTVPKLDEAISSFRKILKG